MSEVVLNLEDEQVQETSMVDLAYEILRQLNTPLYYRDIMQRIAKIKKFDDKQILVVIAQLYTEINIDGRFACVGENLWGLKRWYPMDKTEGMAVGKRFLLDDDFEEEDDEFNYDEPEEDFTAVEGDTETPIDADADADDDTDVDELEVVEEDAEDTDEIEEESDEEGEV